MYKETGRLEVICGSMFSGKSEELIRRIRRGMFAQKKIQVFKHSLDDRFSVAHVHSHKGEKIEAIPIHKSSYLDFFVESDTEIIGIDEIQFFDYNIITIIDNFVRQGKRVIVAGLDLDFRGVPFGPMPYLLALADEVIKLKAVCMKTGKDAHFTQRLVDGIPAKHDEPIVLVGAQNFYEARSRDAFKIDYIPLQEYVEEIKEKNKC